MPGSVAENVACWICAPSIETSSRRPVFGLNGSPRSGPAPRADLKPYTPTVASPAVPAAKSAWWASFPRDSDCHVGCTLVQCSRLLGGYHEAGDRKSAGCCNDYCEWWCGARRVENRQRIRRLHDAPVASGVLSG